MKTSSNFQGLSRRQFLGYVTMATAAAGVSTKVRSQTAEQVASRKMTINLMCGMIGVSANQVQAIDLASRHGFESVEAYGDYLASLSVSEMQDLKARMKEKNILFGAAGLTVDFRDNESKFEEGLVKLPRIAAGLQRAGVTRVGTWIMPCHDTLTYLQNFKQHALRLRKVAEILRDHGQRLGLEYVGTQSLRVRRKYPFVHTLAETRELIVEIGTGNVGFVLDTWHWWMARDTEADILTLTNQDIVAVDLNDAPANIPIEQQMDGRRELPCATGVINLAPFINALKKLNYDGPVRAEPFNKSLNEMDNEAACAATAAAMKTAFALLR